MSSRDAQFEAKDQVVTVRSSMTWRQKLIRALFRWGLLCHAVFLRVVKRLRSRRKPLPAGPRSVLLTGTFFSENWIMNHLRPLALSGSCSEVTVVCEFSIPPTSKVRWVRPPSWLCKLIGATPARLLLFTCMALKRRSQVIGGFHLIPNGLLVGLIAPIIGARSIHFCGGGPREVLDGGILGNRALECVKVPDSISERRLINAMSGIDRIICMGSRSVRFFKDHGVQSDFDVIPGGIDTARFAPAPTEKSYDLVFVGRLVEVKRVDLLLDAVAALVPSCPELRAVIVGSGVLEERLKAQAATLGISSNVEFAGQQADVVAWLRKSRVFVLTSDSEGLSLAMMEALSCGLPCVVSDVGELGEVIQDGVNGFLVRGRNGMAFAETLRPLLADPNLLARVTSGAVESAAAFELGEIVKRWDSILRVHSLNDQGERESHSARSLIV